MKNQLFSLVLLVATAVCIQPDPAVAQFRFQSNSSRSSGQWSSSKHRSSTQRSNRSNFQTQFGSSKKQTTTSSSKKTSGMTRSKTSTQSGQRSKSKLSTASQRIKNQTRSRNSSQGNSLASSNRNRRAQNNKTSGQNLSNSRLKNLQLKNPNGKSTAPTRENWKSGSDILKQAQKQSRSSSQRSKGKTKVSPFDPKAMEQAKGTKLGIFPGERKSGSSGKPISNSNRSSGTESKNSKIQNNDLAEMLGKVSRRNPDANNNPGNTGRGTNVITEEDRAKNNRGRGTNVITEEDRATEQSGSRH